MRGRRKARSARARETCRGRTAPRRCPAAQRERVAAVSAHFLPFALLPDVAEKAEHQEVTVTGVACSRRTRAPRLLAQHTHGRRATHLRGPARAGRRGSSRSAATERRRASLPACEWDVRGGGVMGASSAPSPAWQVVMPQRGVQMGQDWNTVSFGTRPQSAASSHQKQQTLRDAQRTGGQIETTAKHGGGKNGGLSAAAVEANRLDADTGEGSRAPKPPPSRRASIGSAHRRHARARVVGRVLRARRALCTRAPGPRPPRPS